MIWEKKKDFWFNRHYVILFFIDMKTKKSRLLPHKARFFTQKEAVATNRKRERYLRLLSDKICFSFMDNKAHAGALSPGCFMCAKGTWSCVFIHDKCTTDCFFCPGDRKSIGWNSGRTEGIIFSNPDDYADYVNKFGFKGAGFSGGEPLLVFDKLTRYIKTLRKKNGDGLYIWMYSNGDLIDISKLKKLKESGLNEIRFNIAARGYDLKPVRMASGIIDKVTVEIPAIPEDYEIVKRLLPKLYEIGVNFLNIHQLDTYPHNYKNYVKRKYRLLDIPYSPVFASELAALKILKYAVDKKIKLPVNYCSSAYKNNIQLNSKRQRFALWLKDRFYDITEAGYIRSFYIEGREGDLKKVTGAFKRNAYLDGLWALKRDEGKIYISQHLLKQIPDSACNFNLNVSYYKPVIRWRPVKNILTRTVSLNSRKTIAVEGLRVFDFIKMSPLARKTFVKMFIEKKGVDKSIGYFYRNYNLLARKNIKEMRKEIRALFGLRQLEWAGCGFPKIKQHGLPFSFYE
ncbi:MAG: radical SAM protein [Candidatus Omnitrophota bacterium]